MNKKVETVPSPPAQYVIATWAGAIVCLVLSISSLYFIISEFSSFRSCNKENGIALTTCGKQGVTGNDIFLMILFALSAAGVYILTTVALRMTKDMN
jgi:uncharacterized membrane protein YjdF